MTQKKKFSQFSRPAQVGIILTAALELCLKIAAFRDIAKRPSEQVRGPKVLWIGLNFINTVGPVAYFVFGRRKRTVQVEQSA